MVFCYETMGSSGLVRDEAAGRVSEKSREIFPRNLLGGPTLHLTLTYTLKLPTPLPLQRTLCQHYYCCPIPPSPSPLSSRPSLRSGGTPPHHLTYYPLYYSIALLFLHYLLASTRPEATTTYLVTTLFTHLSPLLTYYIASLLLPLLASPLFLLLTYRLTSPHPHGPSHDPAMPRAPSLHAHLGG